MNNWKVIFATVVIFGAGVITGGLLVNYVDHYKKAPRNKQAVKAEARAANARQGETIKLRPPELLCKQFLQQLSGPLQLTPEQRSQIHKIISDGQNQIRKTLQDARLEIREVLTPEQRKKFDLILKRPFRKPLFSTNSPAVLPSNTNAPPSGAN